MSDAASGNRLLGASGRGQTTLRYYLTICRRRRWPIIVSLALPLILAIIFSATQDARYQGSANVVLNRQSLANALTNTPDATAQANDYIRIVQTQAELARSPSVATRALRGQPVSMTPAEFLESATVEPERDADVLVFHVEHSNQRIAQSLANSYARAYVEYRLVVDTMALREATDEVDKRIAALEQEPNGNERLIQSLQSRAQELETLQALQVAKATVVYDTKAAVQVAPAWKRNIALGILVGIVLAITVAALLEGLDVRVRDEQTITEHLGAAPLVRLGPPPDPDAPLVMLTHPASAEAEPYRVLETNLRFAMVDRQIRSLMVTSSVQGEGKSTTIANLAVAMARAGRDVILVDLDLRRPTLRKMFDLAPGPGLTDVLLGSHPLDEALMLADLGGAATAGARGRLRILQAGTPPPNPGELLSPDGQVSRLIADLEGQSDLVLVDAPPALAVGDAIALTAMVDGVFAVVRLRLVTRSMLDELDRALSVGDAVAVGFVATGRMPKQHGYGYGYGYGHSGPESGGGPREPSFDSA